MVLDVRHRQACFSEVVPAGDPPESHSIVRERKGLANVSRWHGPWSEGAAETALRHLEDSFATRQADRGEIRIIRQRTNSPSLLGRRPP